MNKKGVSIIGSFFGLFVLTIAVVLILIVFILGSGIIKKVDRVSAGVAIYNEEGVEIENILTYMNESYADLVEVRFLLKDERDVGDALMEVGYEK